jgi:hypothetical protein
MGALQDSTGAVLGSLGYTAGLTAGLGSTLPSTVDMTIQGDLVLCKYGAQAWDSTSDRCFPGIFEDGARPMYCTFSST